MRITIAGALMVKPTLLLADEPTGELDDVNAGIVDRRLEAYHMNPGTGIPGNC